MAWAAVSLVASVHRRGVHSGFSVSVAVNMAVNWVSAAWPLVVHSWMRQRSSSATVGSPAAAMLPSVCTHAVPRWGVCSAQAPLVVSTVSSSMYARVIRESRVARKKPEIVVGGRGASRTGAGDSCHWGGRDVVGGIVAGQFRWAQGADGGHEVGPQRGFRAYCAVMVGGGHDGVHAAVGDRGEDEAAWGELVEPVWGQAGHTTGDNDAVVRGVVRLGEVAVAVQDGDVVVESEPADRVGRTLGGGGPGVDGDHRGFGDGGDQRGVVAGAGTDLQHAHARAQGEGFEHPGHQRRY
jgi:hypothetical protein